MLFNAVRRNDASALPLHPDAVCEFPTNTYRGAASFQQGLDQFALIIAIYGFSSRTALRGYSFFQLPAILGRVEIALR